MLVLARQRDQTVMIGDDIEVTVVDIRGDKVRLGVNAPRSISVHRKEVYDLIRRENESAARISPADLPPPAHPGPTAPVGTIAPAAAPNPTPPAVTGVAAAAAEPVPADEFMRAAVDEARKALAEGGLPIGSVLVRGGTIIARGHDQRVQKKDPLAHAEIDCLARAGQLGSYRDTVLYSTLMPCYLCAGAVVQLGVPKVVAVAPAAGGDDDPAHAGGADLMRRHGVEVVDAADAGAAELVRRYAAEHPKVPGGGPAGK